MKQKKEDIVDEHDLFIPNLKEEISKENEVEFEVNLNKTADFDIKIVDKPRTHFSELEEEKKIDEANEAEAK